MGYEIVSIFETTRSFNLQMDLIGNIPAKNRSVEDCPNMVRINHLRSESQKTRNFPRSGKKLRKLDAQALNSSSYVGL